MALQLNLAALTEAELLALYGPAGVQAKFPEISRARLQRQPLLHGSVPVMLLGETLQQAGQAWGSPEQRKTLWPWHQALLEEGALLDAVFPVEWIGVGQAFMRAYVLGHTAISLRWLEENDQQTGDDARPPAAFLLTWLRDRASGVACVLTTNAASDLTPAYSEEVDVHRHAGLNFPELLRRHHAHVQRHGKAQKLSPEQGWRKIWQALHELNLQAWKRRGVIVEVPD